MADTPSGRPAAPTTAPTLPYAQVRRHLVRATLRRDEVPIEHEVSLPVPTLRWGVPAYACFAAPAARLPGEPVRLDPPDRWWAVRADTLVLVTYALTAAVRFTDAALDPVVLPPSGRSGRDGREDRRVLDELLGAAATAFLAGHPVDPILRDDLTAALAAVVPAPVLPWYRLLTPDFFLRLEG